MYFTAILLLMLVLPVASVVADALASQGAPDLTLLIGKWFTFWSVGVRLFMAGVMQVFRPQFTAQSIFNIKDDAALGLVREIGFGNLAMGTLGLLSSAKPEWIVPAAIAGGLYYGLAAFGHLLRKDRNFKEQAALVSDFAIFALLAWFVVARGF
jgi:Family of unknown function (DUF6790)